LNTARERLHSIPWGYLTDRAVRWGSLAALGLALVATSQSDRANDRTDQVNTCLKDYAAEQARSSAARAEAAKQDRAVDAVEKKAQDAVFFLAAAGTDRAALVQALHDYQRIRTESDRQRELNDMARAANPLPESPELRCG